MQSVEEAHKQDTAEAMWKAVLKEATSPMAFPNRQLTAYALFDGSRRDKPPGQNDRMHTKISCSCTQQQLHLISA